MSPRSQQTFVYGTFLWPSKAFLQGPGAKPIEPDIAIEILREFSASEFVGKLYTKPYFGNWTAAKLSEIRQSDWYAAFDEKFKQHFVFIMQGSGAWEVLHFRAESDESGPYVAIALREISKAKTPPWVIVTRQRLAL